MPTDLKELTTRDYTIDRLPSNDDLNTSALMRIADATEKMAANYTKLQNDLEMYKRWYKDKCDSVHRRDRSISNLRGQITKLKKKITISPLS
jgi:hypothetical protein